MPSLPTCPPGQLAVPGATACHAVDDCPSGVDPWQDIPADGTTAFVDASSTSSAPLGTKASPFRRISDALAKGATTIAVAAGTYTETLHLVRPVSIQGVCSSKVILNGGSRFLSLEAANVAVRHVSVTKGSVYAGGSGGQRLDHITFHDFGATALDVSRPGAGDVTVEDAVFESFGAVDGKAVFVSGNALTVRRAQWKGPTSFKTYNASVENFGAPSALRLENCRLEGSTFGVLSTSSALTVIDSVIRTGPGVGSAPKSIFGFFTDPSRSGSIQVDHAYLEPQASFHGHATVLDGVTLHSSSGQAAAANGDDAFDVRSSLLQGEVAMSVGSLSDTILEGLPAAPAPGLSLSPVPSACSPAAVHLQRVLLRDFAGFAFRSEARAAKVEDTVALDTRLDASGFGDGFVVSAGVDAGKMAIADLGVDIVRSWAAGNKRIGIAAFGGDLRMSGAASTCNVVDLAASSGFTVSAGTFSRSPAFLLSGADSCGCEGGDTTCLVATTALAPSPPPPDPGGARFPVCGYGP